MNFKVSLDKEQIEEIANITADKVLYTVQYHKNNEKWYEREIEELKAKVQKRDSMLVQKDLIIERQREYLRKMKERLHDEQ